MLAVGTWITSKTEPIFVFSLSQTFISRIDHFVSNFEVILHFRILHCRMWRFLNFKYFFIDNFHRQCRVDKSHNNCSKDANGPFRGNSTDIIFVKIEINYELTKCKSNQKVLQQLNSTFEHHRRNSIRKTITFCMQYLLYKIVEQNAKHGNNNDNWN